MKFVNRRNLLISLVAVALSPACTKCSKKDDADSATSAEGSSGAKKIFYHYRTSEEKTLDPMKQFDQASHIMVMNFYDTLIDYHYLKRPYSLEPGLLETMPEKQPDGTYKLSLRKGVFFHDNECFPGGKGREFNADDVIYSFKRFSDANVNQLSYSIVGGLVEGIDAFREESKKGGKAFDYSKAEISGLKKVDNHTLTIKFTNDSPLNFYPLAFDGLAIVPKEAVDKYGDLDKNPVGTGPFTIKSYSRRGTTVLQKNPKYWQKFPTDGNPEDAAMIAEGAGRQLPIVDEVYLPLIEETQPQMLKFKKGQIHWVAINKDDFSSLVDRIPDKAHDFKLKPDVAKQFELYYEPYLATGYIKFGMRDAVVGKNKALRQALNHAFNSTGFIDLMLNGRGLEANSLVPSEIAGSARDTGSVWYKQDLEMAKKKLAEAGFPEGKGLPKLMIEYRSTSKEARQQFEYHRNEFAKVGIQVEGNFQTFSNFLQKTNAGNFQLADAGWQADYPDAENFYALLYSENRAPLPNDGNFENKRYDELFLQTRNMPNGPERNKLFAEMDAIVKDEAPIILTQHNLAMGLLQKDVRLFKRHMMEEASYKYFDLKK